MSLTPTKRRVTVDGVAHNLLDWAGRDLDQSQPPILCVHGLTRNAHDFDALAAALAGQGRRVLAVDVAGRGESEPLADSSLYSNDHYAGMMLRLLDALDLTDPVDWVGTSMGGLIGMVALATAPARVRRFVLNDVGPYIPAVALQRIKDYIGIPFRFSSQASAEKHFRKAYAPFGPLTDAQWAELTRWGCRQDGEAWVPTYDVRIADPFKNAMPADVVLWPLWQMIPHPTLILRGGVSDLLFRSTALGMIAARPGVEMVEFAGIGHAPALLERDQIDVVTEFLNRA